MLRLPSALALGTLAIAGLHALSAATYPASSMKIMADGDDMNWTPTPPNLPKGMMIAVLQGDPARPGPFTIRVTMPAGTVIAPHTHAQDESLTVISSDFYHGHDRTVDNNQGTEVHTGGFVFLPATTRMRCGRPMRPQCYR